MSVHWYDVKAFCDWLTTKERSLGLLGDQAKYRPTTDREWSLMIGIGDQEDPGALPVDLDAKLPGVYPWGSEWPPVPGSGNYGGTELEQSRSKAKPKQHPIDGFTDPFVYTAPVGSFPADANGLFDLGGNVMEWCLDLYDSKSKNRTCRGAHWLNADPESLLSSDRRDVVPFGIAMHCGFRCVLVIPKAQSSNR